MTINKKIGIILTVLGLLMFVAGVSMFTYQGKPLSPFLSKIGMYSFILWFPVVIIGIILIIKKKS
ncbi:hypothetical protein Solca_0074 [Solitalea canadensis DSM 3403]|uniref:Uncharacterized protein n=1 Tax=Solitalea canadensis (strain ATCC 29591 / DSM 3403 / JCM 21819 / LMG 8368 / NBRC 15130 / NCIMB 12057 / USAM 9D) TaxID=929556 RepID=H8KT48_SOLCM|nr:hypothetical protein Solca_0074 [Solitalea canadensis DSM 3403]